MDTSVFRILVIGFLLACLPVQSFAAGKAKNKTAKKQTASVEVSFDANVGKLPPRFSGNNVITLFTALSKNYTRYLKSEFETNEVFQNRLLKLEDARVTGKVKYNDTVAFTLLTSFKSSYDADSQTMTVTVPFASIQDSDLSDAISYELPPGKGAYTYSSETIYGRAIEVFSTLSKTEKYTGSNAFGTKVKITGKVYDTFAVAVKSDNDLMKHSESITLTLSLPPEKAREAKATGNILLVGNLVHPYIGMGTYHSTATIDDPVEILDRIRYVAMELTDIRYYSIATGEIYHTQQIVYNDTDDNESEAE